MLPFAVVSLAVWVHKNGARRLVPLSPLVVVAILTAAYAWSSHVTMRGQEVLNLDWAFAPFGAITSAFRTCGRFIWPLHYVVSLGAVVLVTRLLRVAWPAVIVLAAAAGLQGYELNANNPAFFHPPPPPIGPAWAGLGKKYKHIQIVPVQVQWVCDYDPAVVSFLTRVAAQEGMTINSGKAGRVLGL